jgi:hypothetical protein
MAKGMKVEGFFEMIRCDTRLVGNMSWETPYLLMKKDGVEYVWTSERLGNLVCRRDIIGKEIWLSAFAYDDYKDLKKGLLSLRRVKVAGTYSNDIWK